MEKNIQASANDNMANVSIVTAFSYISNIVKKPFVFVRNYYSSIIGKEISTRQAWLVTEMQIAFAAVIFPADMSFLLRALAAAWFVSSAIRTRACFDEND